MHFVDFDDGGEDCGREEGHSNLIQMMQLNLFRISPLLIKSGNLLVEKILLDFLLTALPRSLSRGLSPFWTLLGHSREAGTKRPSRQ